MAHVLPTDARTEAEAWPALACQRKDRIKDRERQRRQAEHNPQILNDVAPDCFDVRKSSSKATARRDAGCHRYSCVSLPRRARRNGGGRPDRHPQRTCPIWHSKAATATKAIVRLSVCCRHGAALELVVDLQAPATVQVLLAHPATGPRARLPGRGGRCRLLACRWIRALSPIRTFVLSASPSARGQPAALDLLP